MEFRIFFNLVILVIFFSSCSINKIAMNSIADGLSGGSGSVFTTDDDVDLICEALPLSLKLMEALVKKVPENKGLYNSLASGFMLYSVASLEIEAEKFKETDFQEYRRLRTRAQKLYYRAYQYAFKGLSLAHKKFPEMYLLDRKKALALITEKSDAEALYWTGAALTKWITFSKDDPGAVIRLQEAVEFMDRAIAIYPEYDNGSVYEFFTAYESRSGNPSDTAKAMDYFRKAEKVSGGKKLSVYLAYIESFAIPFNDKKGFDVNMQRIMEFDLNAAPEYKLVNSLSRRKAELLQNHKDDFFFEDEQ
jgi:predicted anti-sigma-YlaC factor YlaD